MKFTLLKLFDYIKSELIYFFKLNIKLVGKPRKWKKSFGISISWHTYNLKQHLARNLVIWHPVDLYHLKETFSIYFNMEVPHHLSQKKETFSEKQTRRNCLLDCMTVFMVSNCEFYGWLNGKIAFCQQYIESHFYKIE